MSGQVWLIADRSPAVIQEGQPPAQQAAWLLDVADDQTPAEACEAFAETQGFPIGTVARMIDAASVQGFRLSSQWVPQ